METNGKRLIIIIAACAAIFLLFVTMLTDLILVSLSVSPVFSRIISAKHENTKYGEITEGHGILYSTITAKEEFANGYFAAYEFFFGFKKWDDSVRLDPEFVLTGDHDEIVHPPEEEDGFGFEEEDIELSDHVLNMNAVRDLAFNGVTAFEFMEKFPGTLAGDDPVAYFVALPNDYVVRIEYSGSTVNYIHLEDHELNLRLDLQTQASELDAFLFERNR